MAIKKATITVDDFMKSVGITKKEATDAAYGVKTRTVSSKTSGGKGYGAEQTEKKAEDAARVDMPWWKDLLLSGIGDAESAFGSYNPTPQERSRVGNTLNAAGKSTTASNLNALGFLLGEDESGQDAAWDAFGADSIYNASKGTWETPKKPEDYELESVKRAKEKAQNWAYQKANEFNEEAAESEKLAKDGLGKVGQTLVDIGMAGAQLSGDAALNAALPGAGLAAMGVRSFGSATEKARNEGADMQQQFNYGVTVAAADALSEKLFDAAKLFGGGGADDVVERIVSKLAKTDAGRTVTRMLLSGVGEGAEEAITDLVEPAIRGAFYDKEAMLASYGTPEGRRELAAQAAYDALIGGVLGVAGGGVGILNGENAQKNTALRTQEQLRQAGYTGTIRQKTKADLEREARQADLLAGNLYRPGDPTRQLAAAPKTGAETDGAQLLKDYATNKKTEASDSQPRGGKSRQRGVESNASVTTSITDSTGNSNSNLAVEDHIDNRTDEYLAKRSVKSFQYNHPELHEYYEAVARDVLEMVDGSLSTDQYRRGMGTVTHNTPALQSVLEETGLTRAELGRALEAIVNDHGAENYAAAKRTEKALDSLLVNGYYTRGSNHVPPNQAYLNAKGGIVGGTDANSWEYYRDNNLSLALGEITEEEAYNDWRAMHDVVESENSHFRPDGFPQGTGAASRGFAGESFGNDMAPTQTHSTDPIYTEAERTIHGLRPEDSQHVVHHDKDVDYQAQERFASDYEGEKQDLFFKKQNWDDVDQNLALRIIANEVAKARETGDYSEVVRLQRENEAHGTEQGQAMRQRARFANTASGMVAQAAVDLSDAQRTRNITEQEKNGILQDVYRYAEEWENIQQGDTEHVIELIKQLNVTRKTAGFFNTKKSSKTLSAALEKVAQQDGGFDFLWDVAGAQIRGVAGDYAALSPLEAAKAIRYQNMLSKLSTYMRNFIGNNVFDPIESISNNIGVLADMLISKRTGRRTTAIDKSWFSDVKRKGSTEAALRSYIEVALDADTRTSENKYEQRTGRTFKMTGNIVERFFSTMGKWQSYALTTTDEFQKGGIRAETQRGIDALTESGKIERGALDGWADETARQRTFQNDGAIAKTMIGLRDAANNIALHDSKGGSLGVGDVAVPFAKVPGNVAEQFANYSPAGIARGAVETVNVLRKAKNGTVTAQEQAQAARSIGRALNGTAILALFGVAAAKGILNVAGSDDKDKEALEKSEGITGTQLNLSALGRLFTGKSTEWRDGDDLMNIGFLEPINGLMAMGALLADAYEADGTLTAGDIITSNGTALLQTFLDLPAMSQIQELVNGYRYSKEETGGGKALDALGQYLGSQASSFVVPNAVSGIAQGIDQGVTRNTRTSDKTGFSAVPENAWSNFKSKIPFARGMLPATLDNWGNEKKTTASPFQNWLNSNVLPGSINQYKTNAVNQELSRLYGKVDVAYPDRKAPNSANFDEEKQTLTNTQRETYQKTYGQTAYSNVKSLINSAQYGKMSDGERAAAINYLYQYATTQAKKKVGADGGETPSWTSKSEGSIAENAAYRAFLDTARAKAVPMSPSTSKETNGAQMQGTLKLNLSDAYKLNVFAQFLGEGAQEHVHEAYSKGYSLQQITDFYQAMNLKDESGKAVYKKDDLIRWATQNGFTYGQAQTMYRIFHPSKKNG